MRVLFDDIAVRKLCTEKFIIRLVDKLYSFFGLYRCVHCGRYSYTICDTCKRGITYLPYIKGTLVLARPSSTADFPHMSFFHYTKVVKSLFAVYKFQRAFQYQRVIEDLLADYSTFDPFFALKYFAGIIDGGSGPVVVIPVPMTQKKYQMRGFSPAYEIAIMLGRLLTRISSQKIYVVDTLITKTRETKAQSKKHRQARLLSIHNSFSINESELEKLVELCPKTIIIVDDVRTTGATITEMRETLEKSDIHTKLPNVKLRSFSFAQA